MAGGLLAGYGAFAWIAARFLYPARTTPKAWLFVATVGDVAVGGSIRYRTPGGATVNITRRAGGTALFVIMAIFSVYPMFASFVPAPFGSASVPLLDTAAFHVFSRESVLGVPMRAFAEIVIGFLVFGTALQFTGAGTFFIDFAFRSRLLDMMLQANFDRAVEKLMHCFEARAAALYGPGA